MRNGFLTKAILLGLVLGVGVACDERRGEDDMPIVPASPAAPPPAAPAPPASSIEGSVRFSPEESIGAPPAGSTFAMDQLEDLHVLIAWQNLEGDRQMTVRFVAPNGIVYVSKTVVLSAADDLRIDGKRAAWVALPVAGTNITARGLVGDWHTEAELDDGAAKVSRAFTLTQP